MQDPVYNRIESTPRPSILSANVVLLAAALGLWASELLLLLARKLGSVGLVAENLLYYLPFVALPLFLCARRKPGLSEALRLNPLSPLSLLVLFPTAWCTVLFASLFSALWGTVLDALGLVSLGSLPVAQSEGELAVYVIALAAIPALCEELLFRGFILSAWESRGTRFAIAVSAILFALLHGNLYGLPSYLLVGLISGFMTWAVNSVYAGMVFHMLYNAICMILPRMLAVADPAVEASEAQLGAADFILLLGQFAVFAGMMLIMLTVLRRHAQAAGNDPIPRIRRPLSTTERLTLLAAVLVMLASTVILAIMAAQMGGVA